MSWPQSPPATDEQCVLPLEGTLAKRYQAWRGTEAGRIAFELFFDAAVVEWHRGAPRIGSKAIAERIRPRVPGGIDNRWTAHLAREAVAREPGLAALAVTRRHVDLDRWLVRMPGTKTYNRDRVAIVAEWARSRLADRCRGLLPDAPLFPTDRWRATKWHARVAEEQGLRHLKLHAARNHWAVRALRGGWSVEAVAKQLGNTPQMVLKVYGRFRVSAEDLERLERMAEIEAKRREAM